ncbi:MAG: Gfo/Idh/MocA family oxidoreductase [Bacteroidota bacterium]
MLQERNQRMRQFAITGVAGYIAPRHLRAIRDTGNQLVAALDPHDSVGILDQFGHEIAFFTEFERFDRHLEKMRRAPGNQGIDYLSICSPNYLHDAHIRLALRLGANAICEKPLVITPWQIDTLQELEAEYPGTIHSILQLRVHPNILALREKILATDPAHRFQVSLTYITSRGAWYGYSWKGDPAKSGGIATNIGIHFFDMLLWMFGGVQSQDVYLKGPQKMSGFLELERADVTWYLSLDKQDLTQAQQQQQPATFRSMQVDGIEVDFTGGFTDLHTRMYETILQDGGYGLSVVRPSIELAYRIRTSECRPLTEMAHPMLQQQPLG